MSLELLKHEVLKPAYIMCNECEHFKELTCGIFKSMPPREVMLANPFKKKDNKKICKHFKSK